MFPKSTYNLEGKLENSWHELATVHANPYGRNCINHN